MNLVVYILLFVAVGVVFILVHLVAGKLIRPSKPDAEKKTIYECGEPTIGSAWIQFDLRFYVVALLFVIFDVEVAFFFPWAEVFGKANDVAAPDKSRPTAAAYRDYCQKVLALARIRHTPGDPTGLRATGERRPEPVRRCDARPLIRSGRTRQPRPDSPVTQAKSWPGWPFSTSSVFFGVLLVGFAYLWRRGDLAWVRSVTPSAGRRTAAAAGARPPAEGRRAGSDSRR